MITQETDIEKLTIGQPIEEIEEVFPPYCIELKEMWDQFDSQIKWTASDYSKGWVRLGDINLARISFWKESPYSNYDLSDRDPPLKPKEIKWSKLVADHYSGYYIHIYNIARGTELWHYQIDFGRDAYLHKESWKWHDDYDAGDGDLIKKAARAWNFIEAWCL